jgi:hypothetical protein
MFCVWIFWHFSLLPRGVCQCSARQPTSPLSNSCISICFEALFSHPLPVGLLNLLTKFYRYYYFLSLLPSISSKLPHRTASPASQHPILTLKLATIAFSYLLLPPACCDPVFSVFQLRRSRYIKHAAHPPSLLSSTPQPSSTSLFSSA